VLLTLGDARVYRRNNSSWKYVADMSMAPSPRIVDKQEFIDQLTANDYSTIYVLHRRA
jgi:hypothetical protein